MSSSSSDSDSDDFEPIRKIKINIRPKGDVVGGGGKAVADVNEIKASVEAWRPLGPPVHPSLSRRQSSLSSVSSMSFGASGSGSGLSVGATTGAVMSNNNYATTTRALGAVGGGGGDGGGRFTTSTTIRSSPSCLSLVNTFNNRSSFTNFMSATTSRTSSPSALIQHGDGAVPVAIAIQESIELIVKGHYDPNAIEPKFQSRSMGNIKIAFSNAFAKGSYGKLSPVLRLRLHSTERIIKYYASRLIKDLDLGTQKSIDQLTDTLFYNKKQQNDNNDSINISDLSNNSKSQLEQQNFNQSSLDSFGATAFGSNPSANFKLIEFNFDILMSHLRKMYDQTPGARYYNVDVLRYQISPITSIAECPLQVCAYWKIESDMVKLRIDFKHSSESGLGLERLRELSFSVDFASFLSPQTEINNLSPDSLSTIRLNNNNNDSGASDMNVPSTARPQADMTDRYELLQPDAIGLIKQSTGGSLSSGTDFTVKPGPPPIAARSSITNNTRQPCNKQLNQFPGTWNQTSDHSIQDSVLRNPSSASGLVLNDQGRATKIVNTPSSNHRPKTSPCNNATPPYITYEPQAHWDNSIKQLTWKFDTLLSYHKTDGLGSLFAKLDFRDHRGMKPHFLQRCKPSPVEVKFLVKDSTLSKINMSIETLGYKMSLLKKEIRSGCYRSEPYIL